MNTMADGAAQRLVDEIDLIRAVLEGYPASIARSDALRAARAIRSALAGQPSSGGQGDALAMIGDNLRSMRVLAGKLTVTQDGNVHLANIKNEIARALQLLDPAVAASQSVGISAEWILGYLTTDAPEESREAIRNAFTEYAALSGARQPMREPVCADCGTPLLYECTGCSKMNYPERPQAVDLGRVRASIQSVLNWIDDWAETPEESGIDAIEAEAEAVLALIDSQERADD